jgi:hypothetical protein
MEWIAGFPSGGPETMHANQSSLTIVKMPTQTVNVTQSLPMRQTGTVTTPVLTTNQVYQGTISLARSYRLLHISVSANARVRLYSTAANQANDVSRLFGVNPPEGAGVILDWESNYPTLTQADLTPTVDGSSMESTPSTNIPISITSLNGGAVTVNLTWLALEA